MVAERANFCLQALSAGLSGSLGGWRARRRSFPGEQRRGAAATVCQLVLQVRVFGGHERAHDGGIYLDDL